MSKYIQKVVNKVAENLLLSYLIGFMVGTFLFLIVMLLYNWDTGIFIEVTFLLILTSISGITMNFLSGLGIIITYAMICALFFRLFSGVIKGKKGRGKILKIFFLGLAGLICGYGVYVFIMAILYTRPLTFIEKLISLVFGMWSLIFFVYLIPVIQGEYRPLYKENLRGKIKGKFGGFKYSLWSGYQSRIRKDYGKVYSAEYESYKTDIEDIRDQLSGLLLLPFMIILIAFLPLMGIAIILWIRIFSLDKKPFTTGEKILLLLILAGVLIISTFIFLFVNITELLAYFNISYAIGIFSGVILLIYLIIKS